MDPLKKSQYSKYNPIYPFYVTWVDQNSTVNDEQQTPTLNKISPVTGRNLHIGGFKLNKREGGVITINILVPQEVLGSFKMPQPGDIVMIQERKQFEGEVPVYLYSTYNNIESDKLGSNPVPQWGSRQGDYGHLRSYKDHNKQFSAKENSNFVKKFIRSVTGYRFRNYYKSNLTEGKFVMRGDPVFDINPQINEAEDIVEDGVDIGYGDTITKSEQKDYPNPLNVPKVREDDDNYSYSNLIYQPIPVEIDFDPNKFGNDLSKKVLKTYDATLKNKHYHSYQPIMDKTYLNEVEFERELPAAEEFQVALRGNNKLLIQDQAGDGEQLLITLKNQYDGQFTIVHNGDKGQVRIRDHLGQGVLMEADPEHPRVLSWTSSRQKVEQGFIPEVGAYTYVRNGENFGDSDTSFGTKTGVGINDVSNQEIFLASTGAIASEVSSKLSSGMSSLALSASAAGIFMRNNLDPEDSNQTYAIYNTEDSLVTETSQAYVGLDGWEQNSTHRYEITGGVDVVESTSIAHDAPGSPTSITETRTVSNGSTSKSYNMVNGADSIVETESISGPNAALKSTVITSTDASVYTNSYDASSNKVTLSNVTAGNTTNDIILTPGSNLIKYYDAGTEKSQVHQTAALLDVERLNSGVTINIGNDGQTDPINIGHATADINILGSTVNVEGNETQIGNGGTNNIVGENNLSTTNNLSGTNTLSGTTNFSGS